MDYELLKDSSTASAILSGYGDLLNVKDLASIFSVSEQTIYKEIKDGKFGKPIQIGRVFKIPKIYILRHYFLSL